MIFGYIQDQKLQIIRRDRKTGNHHQKTKNGNQEEIQPRAGGRSATVESATWSLTSTVFRRTERLPLLAIPIPSPLLSVAYRGTREESSEA
jgi:hypothetical protein